MGNEDSRETVVDSLGEKPEPVKHVVESVFGKPEEEKKRFAMRVDLHEHETIQALAVEVKENLNVRDWQVGDTLELTIIGVQRRGSVEGVRVV